MEERLTYFDEQGNAWMADVGDKQETSRIAVTHGFITVSPEVCQAIINGTAEKNDVLGMTRVIGVMGTKETSELIPLCYMLMLTRCMVEFILCKGRYAVEVVCTAKTHGRTGVRMEALAGIQIALLTVYGMCKVMDKRMVVSDVCLLKKHGRKSGLYEGKTSRPGTGKKG